MYMFWFSVATRAGAERTIVIRKYTQLRGAIS